MANQLMSGGLSDIIKQQLDQASKSDKALASAMQTKKFEDCVQAIFGGFRKLATSNCAMSGDDSLIGSAAIHWYTEANPTVDSIADILKGGTEIIKMNAPSSTPKAAPKAEPIKATKPKASTPKAAPAKPAAPLPTPAPEPKPTMQVLKPSAEAVPTQEVEEFDDLDLDDFDPLD